MPSPWGAWKLILAAALVSVLAVQTSARPRQNEVEGLQQRFERETDPVRKAKMMQQLGRHQFDEIQKEVNKDNLQEALQFLQQYRDDARTCIKGLDVTKTNAARHSSGFKQLQISLREALRRLDELIPGLTSDQQTPFLAVRSDLKQMNDHLVQELFPGPAPNGP